MSFCDRQAIPDMLLRGPERQRYEVVSSASNSEEDDSEADEDTLDDDLQMLEDYSFVSLATDLTTWDMHRLVQDATQRWLHINQKFDKAYERYIEQLHAVVPTGKYENWKTCRMLAPHVRSAIELMASHQKTSLLWATIMNRMVRYEVEGGNFVNAEEFANASLRIRRELLGARHPDTLLSMGNLASTYRNQGRWKEAEDLEVGVLETFKTVLGAEHLDTLISMGNLAATYSDQGRWKEAEELEVEVLEIRNTVLGVEHPDTLTSIANLATTYWNQGRWKEAEELGVEVLETRKTVLGAEHPDTLKSMNNLLAMYYGQERMQEAMELAQECARLRVRVLGLTHPDTQTSIDWLEFLEKHDPEVDIDEP